MLSGQCGYWRVRTRYSPTEEDFTRRAWERNEVGIWYGAWTAEDFEIALQQDDPKDSLNRIQNEKGLAWEISNGSIHTARRFFHEIKSRDWVVVCFDGQLHLGQIADSTVSSDQHHELNQGGEYWKFRKIAPESKKSFHLLELPDFYLLIPQAGQGNVFQYQGNNRLAVEILAESRDVSDVERRFINKEIEERLDFMGPKAWESFCLGYLILTEDFLPTGVSTGGTLQAFDIVGYSRRGKIRVIAQCKKDPSPQPIAKSFIAFAEKAGVTMRAMYFAYSGCTDSHPNVEVISIEQEPLKSWIRSDVGKQYLDSMFIRNV